MAKTVPITSLPVIDQPTHHSAGALIDHLARRMRLRAESTLAPLGLRPRHLDAEQRETLYRLLHQATSDHVVDCRCPVDHR